MGYGESAVFQYENGHVYEFPEIMIIPSTIHIHLYGYYDDDYTVTTICDLTGTIRIGGITNTSAAHNVISVTIPNTITRIDNGAFKNFTALPWITIPEGVTYIGDNAFENDTSLTSITIPSTVTHIGADAFKNCPNLQTII